MINQMQDFMNEQVQILTGQAQKFGTDPLTGLRETLGYSVQGFESLKEPVRVAAKSGIQLSAVSQKAAQELIELQSGMLTAALTDVATSLERAASAKSLADLFSAQAETMKDSGERLVADANRAVGIFTDAGRGVQKIATQAYETVAKTGTAEPRAAKASRARKTKRASRKPAAKAAA
jgi:phasin family protein